MNILIAGVGGQGTLLASKMLGAVAMKEGLDVKLSEVHGMSQRGGSVVTYVKIAKKGEEIGSPVIDLGEADFILAFEELEAARWFPYLKKGGTMIVNTQRIKPMAVILGNEIYPNNIIEKIKESNIKVLFTDALAVAEEAGTSKAVNIVLIGVYARLSEEIEKRVWLEALEEVVPKRLLDVNIKAFERGYRCREDIADGILECSL